MAATGPIEMRQFLRLATLKDIAEGVQPLRQMTGAGPQLFVPPVLQFRFKVRVKAEDGTLTDGWSAWSDVSFEREGDPPPH